MSDPWLPWLYVYGVGGLFFVGSMLVAIQTRAIRWDHPPERRLFLGLVGGLLLFMTVHAAWIAAVTPTAAPTDAAQRPPADKP